MAEQVKQRRQQSLSHCEKIVGNLVEQLLQTEENDPNIFLEKGKEKSVHIADIIVAIAFFCEAHPPFVCKHLKTLLPYLKGDSNLSNDLSSLVSLKVTEILSSASTLAREMDVPFNVEEVVASLTHIALNYSNKNINAAINCLALIITNVTEDATPLFSLAERCYKVLLDAVRQISSVASPETTVSTVGSAGSRVNSFSPIGLVPAIKSQVDRLQRCLIVLGYVCEHVKKCSTAFQQFAQGFPLKIELFISSIEKNSDGIVQVSKITYLIIIPLSISK